MKKKRRSFKIILSIVVILILASIPLLGQDSTNLVNLPPEPEIVGNTVLPMTSFEFYLSIIILVFGLILVGLEIFLIKSRKISSDDTIKFIIITLIITSTLFLITAGYSNDQIAPAVGLLGTIAGYLLGRIQKPIKSDGGQKDENID